MTTASALAVVLVLVTARVAAAETTVQALGTAPIAGGDVDKAKTAATDDAFRQAVSQALSTMLDPEVREAHAAVIKKRVLRQARTWVPKFKVIEEGEAQGVYQVRIEATVDTAALERELRRLKVPLFGEAPEPREGDAPGGRPAGGREAERPRMGVLVVAEDPRDAAPLVDALAAALEARGFEVTKLPVAETPVDDGAAATRAHDAGARAVLVASAVVRDGGRVRATRLQGVELDVAARVVDASGGAPVRLVEARVGEAGVGGDEPEARAAAARAIAERLGSRFGPPLEKRWPRTPPGAAGTIVLLDRVVRWAEVADVLKRLAAVPGVDRVVVRGLGPRQVTLVVVGAARPGELVRALGAVGPTNLDARGAILVQLSPPAVPGGEAPGEGRR